VIIAAVWFTIVHLEPVEFPGLFAFALVLGLCFARTKRIGLSIVAHVAFNVTGLVLVLTT
jgi:membrane protease YdiL (CAAX protease family)